MSTLEAEAKRGASMETKASGFEVRSIEEVKAAGGDPGGWKFDGYFSVFNVVDSDNDIIRPGAFAASLAADLPKIKDHHGVTVGQATAAVEDTYGLKVSGRIYPTTAGKDLALLMQGVETDRGTRAPVEQGSIGYGVPATGAKRLPDGTRELTEIVLYEVSPVTFGANSYTRIGLVKGLTHSSYDGPIAELLTETSRALLSAVSEAKALAIRRAAGGRDLGAENADAVAELAFVAGDAMMQLVALDGKAARAGAVSNRRRAYLAEVLRALRLYVDSLPDTDRAELAEMISGADATAADAASGKAGGGDADAETKAADAADSAEDGDNGAEAPALDYRAELEREFLMRQLAAHSTE